MLTPHEFWTFAMFGVWCAVLLFGFGFIVTGMVSDYRRNASRRALRRSRCRTFAKRHRAYRRAIASR